MCYSSLSNLYTVIPRVNNREKRVSNADNSMKDDCAEVKWLPFHIT